MEINVFPNPSNGSVNIYLPRFDMNSKYQYQLMDVSGRVYDAGKIVAAESRLAFQVPTGMYLIQIQSESSIGVAKIIIQQAD
jgi:hypothetical protein